MTQPLDTFHIDAGRLAAFLDQRLTPAEHGRVLAHFAECASCRREMTSVKRVLNTARKRPVIANGALAVLAAAALTIAFLPRLVSRETGTPLTPPSSERARQPDLTPRIEIIHPNDGATVAKSRVELRWRSIGRDATYRVVVQDSAGVPVWEATIGDTVAAVPAGVRLGSAGVYFWSVDAQLIDGRTARARVHRFVTR